jgi:(4-(4-[2-(gamma-L-glutamylamino)ethyl]phenoxymethyl)furan-2-yl)methanamine synthase
MAERFATSDDCYLALGLTAESPEDCDTADNRPRTQAYAHARLARMIGEDSETLPFESAQHIAEQIVGAQARQVAEAIARNLPSTPVNITIAGHGRQLASRAIAELAQFSPTVTWLAGCLSPAAARCAPALAVANLLAKHLRGPL